MRNVDRNRDPASPLHRSRCRDQYDLSKDRRRPLGPWRTRGHLLCCDHSILDLRPDRLCCAADLGNLDGDGHPTPRRSWTMKSVGRTGAARGMLGEPLVTGLCQLSMMPPRRRSWMEVGKTSSICGLWSWSIRARSSQGWAVGGPSVDPVGECREVIFRVVVGRVLMPFLSPGPLYLERSNDRRRRANCTTGRVSLKQPGW